MALKTKKLFWAVIPCRCCGPIGLWDVRVSNFMNRKVDEFPWVVITRGTFFIFIIFFPPYDTPSG
jgi:hypothetical protein